MTTPAPDKYRALMRPHHKLAPLGLFCLTGSCIATAGIVLAAAGCKNDPDDSSAGQAHSHDRLAAHSHDDQVILASSADGIPFHRPAGTGKAYYGPGDLYTFLATGDETANAYFQFEAIVPPKGGPPAHIHLGEDESFYLAEGTLQMLLGDKTVTVRAGDFVNVPRGTAHRFVNVSDKPAKLIVTFVPAGFEKYFEEVLPVAQDRTAAPPPVTQALIDKMIEAGPRHRVTFLPPPATQPAK